MSRLMSWVTDMNLPSLGAGDAFGAVEREKDAAARCGVEAGVRLHLQHHLADRHLDVLALAEEDLIGDLAFPAVGPRRRRVADRDMLGPDRDHDRLADAE